jgi:hypothetical protein
MRSDHHDKLALSQVTVQTVTVIGPITNQSLRRQFDEAVSKDAFYELLSCGEALSILTARGRL